MTSRPNDDQQVHFKTNCIVYHNMCYSIDCTWSFENLNFKKLILQNSELNFEIYFSKRLGAIKSITSLDCPYAIRFENHLLVVEKCTGHGMEFFQDLDPC